MSLWDLSPWDQLPYFQTVKESNIVGAVSATQLVAANNMRAGLMISSINSAVSMFLSTSPSMTTSNALQFTGAASTVSFFSNAHGILPSQAWFGICNGNIHVIELLMIDWPKEGGDHLDAIAHPPAPFPTPAPVKGPGVNNDQGVLSYWRSLMQKIGGK